eukprot:gene32182-biopygen58752
MGSWQSASLHDDESSYGSRPSSGEGSRQGSSQHSGSCGSVPRSADNAEDDRDSGCGEPSLPNTEEAGPGGTLDCVIGDRGRALFNAAGICIGHRATAAACAMLASSLEDSGGRTVSRRVHMFVAGSDHLGIKGSKLSVGAGSGSALVGNVGSEALRVFSVLSSVALWAAAVERLSAQRLGACLVDAVVKEQARDLIYYLRASPASSLRLKQCHTFLLLSVVRAHRHCFFSIAAYPLSVL